MGLGPAGGQHQGGERKGAECGRGQQIAAPSKVDSSVDRAMIGRLAARCKGASLAWWKRIRRRFARSRFKAGAKHCLLPRKLEERPMKTYQNFIDGKYVDPIGG